MDEEDNSYNLRSKRKQNNNNINSPKRYCKFTDENKLDNSDTEESEQSEEEIIHNQEINVELDLNNILKNSIMKVLKINQNSYEEEYEDNEQCYNTDEDEYFESLPDEDKYNIEFLQDHLKEKKNIPFRFNVLQSNIPDHTKCFIIKKLNYFNTLDFNDNEYHKLSKWIEHLSNVPFNKYFNSNIDVHNISSYLCELKQKLDNTIYGHNEAKIQIIQYLAQKVINKNSKGYTLAIQGPPGNGKTTLIKKGIAEALNRPFGFIALGGSSDCSFLEGHDYTYEGSQPGRIIHILQECKCMNPIIYFDELDKISDTPKGEEITNFLCHLIDYSQNNSFHDKYFQGIDFDLSQVDFIFSFNDINKINPILKDRLNIIKTDSFSNKEKINIVNNYLLKDICNEINFDRNNIILNDSIIYYILEHYTNKELGVRELKRVLHNILLKINLYNLLKDGDKSILPFKFSNFKLPYELTINDIHNIIKEKQTFNYNLMYI